MPGGQQAKNVSQILISALFNFWSWNLETLLYSMLLVAMQFALNLNGGWGLCKAVNCYLYLTMKGCLRSVTVLKFSHHLGSFEDN